MKQKALAKPFVENIIWKIFINISLGVWYLHSQRIIHRDLKPLNIFMAKESVAKVGDLGCALKLSSGKEDVHPQCNMADMEADMDDIGPGD